MLRGKIYRRNGMCDAPRKKKKKYNENNTTTMFYMVGRAMKEHNGINRESH